MCFVQDLDGAMFSHSVHSCSSDNISNNWRQRTTQHGGGGAGDRRHAVSQERSAGSPAAAAALVRGPGGTPAVPSAGPSCAAGAVIPPAPAPGPRRPYRRRRGEMWGSAVTWGLCNVLCGMWGRPGRRTGYSYVFYICPMQCDPLTS